MSSTTSQVALASAGGAAAAFWYWLNVVPKVNVFDEVPKYRRNTPHELGNPEEWSKVKRCQNPSDELQIVYSKCGAGAVPAQTITQLFDEVNPPHHPSFGRYTLASLR